jgi:membrane-bound serine protease (ClpP class)
MKEIKAHMYKKSLLTLWFILLVITISPFASASAQSERPVAMLMVADGAVTPAMAGYLERGIQIAEGENAEVLIFQLNTPGGALDVMTEMVEAILASQVPVVVYVAPKGAMAGSAGVMITLAGHASAMAPETTIGAASPVGGEGEDLDETMEAKQKNIMRATVRSLAEERGEEAVALAEDMIESASAATSTEAYEIGLVDFIAEDVDDLLEQLDGFTVTIDGEQVTLNTANAIIEDVSPTFIEQLLQVLTNPNIVFLLLTIGVQSILIEISSPGGWMAGFIGVVSLALATYGLGILPVNWFGLIFLAIAFVLFILDIKAPTHGALTAAGVGSLIVGALILFNSPGTPSFLRVSIPLVVGVSIASGLMFFAIMIFALRAQVAPIRTGTESMLGRTGIAQTDLVPNGYVRVGGEQWSAEKTDKGETITRGTQIEVVRVEGLRLYVKEAWAGEDLPEELD